MKVAKSVKQVQIRLTKTERDVLLLNVIRRYVPRPWVKAAKILLGKEAAGRGVTPCPDDVYLVDYPKSGVTWLRFLVGNLRHPEDPVNFSDIESKVPSIYLNPDRVLRKLPRPRILFSHEAFFARYHRVIYIVRDPRDIAISYYHYLIKYRELAEGYPVEDYIPRFIREDFDAKYGPWDEHVLSWLQMRGGQPDFLLLRYENLLADTEAELGRVAAFLGLPGEKKRLATAVALSSADRMRRLEQRQSRKWAATRKSRRDRPFVRSATSGEWRSTLSENSVRQIECAWGSAMLAVGYELSMIPQPKVPVTQDFYSLIKR